MASAQAATAAQIAVERPPCTLGALARILKLETLDVGAVPSSAWHAAPLRVLCAALAARLRLIGIAARARLPSADDSGRKNDVFRGHNLREGTYSPRVFGGQARRAPRARAAVAPGADVEPACPRAQLIGQALVAASRTVPDSLAVHSLHAYFLLPGDVAAPFIYIVERTRDGKSFATRHVTAQQHGQPVFEMTASFQRHERGFEHAAPMPGAPSSPARLVRTCPLPVDPPR